MSATTELLLEQIKVTEMALKRARSVGDEATALILQQKLETLQESFSASSNALNEGRAVLKG